MKKHFLITILLIAFSMAATAQNKKIAILETVDKEGNVPYGIRLQLRSNLTYAISNTPGYEGYDRVDMASIMGEHDFQRTGMVSNEQIRQLGEMTGCSSILVAEAAVYDKDNIIITAKILNVETASVEKAVPPQIANTNPKEMQNACIELAAKLIEKESTPTKSTTNNKPMKKESPIKQKEYIKQFFGINIGVGYCLINEVFHNTSTSMLISKDGYLKATLGVDMAYPISETFNIGLFVSGGSIFIEGRTWGFSLQSGPLLLYNINRGAIYLGGGLSHRHVSYTEDNYNVFGPAFRLGYKFLKGFSFFVEYDHTTGSFDNAPTGIEDKENSFLLHLGYWF